MTYTTRFWAAAAIIALVVLVGFALSVPHTHDGLETATENTAAKIPSVTLHDTFKKGVHTITGSLEVPDACTTVTARTVTVGNASSTESIRVIISMTVSTGVCLQLPTTENFSTDIVAPSHLPFSAIVNGEEASTTVL